VRVNVSFFEVTSRLEKQTGEERSLEEPTDVWKRSFSQVDLAEGNLWEGR